VAILCASHRFVDDAFRDYRQPDVLGLTHSLEPIECVILGTPGAAPDDPDRLVDYLPADHRAL